VVRAALLAAITIAATCGSAQAQDSQVWPEVGAFVRLTPQTRLYVLATTVEEARDSTSGEFGPNLDFYVRPIRDRKHWAGFKLDESKNRTLLLRVGYRYLPTFDGDDPDEHRGIFEGTARYPLVRGVLVSSRNRLDLRFIEREHSWRYRNRVSVERETEVGRLRVNPYLRFEVFYDSRVAAWSRTESVAGASFPAGRWEFEGYFDYQHDTGGSANRSLRAVGVVVNLYIR
jgi:hypothetical protein